MFWNRPISTPQLLAFLVLGLTLVSNSAMAQGRWLVDVHAGAGIDGLLRAAEARGCTAHIQTDRFISFDCPQGQRPVAEAREALRYQLHDSTTNALIGADEVHAGISPGAFDGTGVRVAVVDTGYDTSRPDLQDVLEACVNTTGDANACHDVDGHGTAVSGIISGIVSSSGGQVGPDSVAPAARIVSVKVFPDDGRSIYSDDVAQALLVALSYGPDVINLSVGGGKSTQENCDASGDPAVDVINIEAVQADALVVVSSGNEGFQDGIGFPACASRALAVGAVYQRNEGRLHWGGCLDRKTTVDQVTCFSNSGPALDVVAPGAFVLAPVLGGSFDWFHGTSASAPVASGAAALLVQQSPGLSAAQIHDAMSNTALELGSGKNQQRNGDGRIDSVLASEYADTAFQTCNLDSDCIDPDVCNGTELCDLTTGYCSAGAPLSCDDGDPCTQDSCHATDGCVHEATGVCGQCTPASKGRCNCDGKCTRKEANYGVCGDCL